MIAKFTLTTSAFHWQPKFASEKLVVGFVWIFSVVLVATYTGIYFTIFSCYTEIKTLFSFLFHFLEISCSVLLGNLIASLTVQKRTWPVDTLQVNFNM